MHVQVQLFAYVVAWPQKYTQAVFTQALTMSSVFGMLTSSKQKYMLLIFLCVNYASLSDCARAFEGAFAHSHA